MVLALAREIEAGAGPLTAAEQLARATAEFEEDKAHFRQKMIRTAALENGMSGEELDQLLDANRWVRRVNYHASRIAFHAGARPSSPPSKTDSSS